MAHPTRILVLSRSIVGSRMSAPGIRAYHMAQVLGRHVPNGRVTLGVPAYSDVAPEPGFRVVKYTRLSLLKLFYRYDIIVSLGFPPMSLPAFFSRIFVLDFFSNFAMEWMEVGKTQRTYRKRWAWYETARQYINYQLTAADFVICNNDRQRDAWLGMMQSLGLITGEVYDQDHSLRRLVAVAPHGIRPDAGVGSRESGVGRGDEGKREEGRGKSREGSATGAALTPSPSPAGWDRGASVDDRVASASSGTVRDAADGVARIESEQHSPLSHAVGEGGRGEGAAPLVPAHRSSLIAQSSPAPADSRLPTPDSRLRAIPGVGPGDIVLLWNAGIVGWYDPVTAIRAVHALGREDVKLVFMGSKYPDPGFLEENPTFKAAIETAQALGVTDKQVLFVRGWLPYEEVKAYLEDSYLGLSTYVNNAETHYSHRTRFLDLFWAELPIVCTRGDVLSEMVEQRELGVVTPEGDVEAVIAALRRLLDDKEFYERCRANLRALKPHITWDETLAALVAFCRDPRPIAVPKRERAVPLLRRTAGYLFWRAVQKVV
jgi:glycosyltransferase involved in cell wall biosynthesis